MDSLIEELEFIALAGRHGMPGAGTGGPRRVSSIEGVQFYGQPMNSIIVPDVAEALHSAAAKMGIQPPKGGLSGPSGKEKAPAAPGEAPKLKLKIKPSTLTGPQKFKVGKSDYSAPNGSKLIRPIGQDGLAYIRTPKGEVHAFNEAGEIEIPATLKTIYETKFAGDLKGDTKYAEEQFPQTSSSHSIESLSAGAILTDQQGTPQFKKLDNGDWEHLDLGVKLDEKDIKPSFDSGDLIPEKNAANDTAEKAFANTEATNFADMRPEEFKAALDGMAEGDTLDVKDSPDKPLTKMADGSWSMETSAGSNIKITSESLNFVKAKLSLPNGQKKEQAHKLDAQAPTSPLDSKPAAKPALTKGDKPDATWINNALPGSEATYTGDMGDTVWRKDESGSWGYTDGEGVDTKISGQQFTNVAKTSWDKLKISKEGKAPTTTAEKSAPDAPAAPKASAPAAPKATEKKKKYSEGDKVSTDDLAAFPEGEGVTVHYTAPVGSGTKASDSTFKKIGPNQWTDMHTSYSGFHAPDKTDEQVKKLTFAKHTELLYTKDPKEKDLSKVEKKYVETTDPNLEGAAVPNKEHTFFELKKNSASAGQVVAPADIPGMETGTTLMDKEHGKFTKQENGEWKSAEAGFSMPDGIMQDRAKQNKLTLHSKAPTKAANESYWNDAANAPAPKSSFNGDTPEQFSKKLFDARVGTKLVAEDGSVPFKKHPDGFWTQGKSSKGLSHGVMYDKKDSLTMVTDGGHVVPSTAKGPETLSYNDFASLPIGSAVLVKDGKNSWDLTKTGDNEWTDMQGLKIKSAIFKNAADSGNLSLITKKGPYAPKDNLPAGVPEGATVISTANLDTVEVGASIHQLSPHSTEVLEFVKMGPDLWQDQHANMGYSWKTKNLTSNPDTKFYLSPASDKLKAPTDSKGTRPPKLPAVTTAPTKAGDKINNVSELEGLAPKTVLNYTQKGGKVSHYTKLDNGMWLTPGGSKMTGAQLKNGANNNKFTIGSVPETGAPKSPNSIYAPGERIEKFGHLREMPIGTKLDTLNIHGAPAYQIEKHADGWHTSGMSAADDVHVIEPSEMADILKGVGLEFVSSPKEQKGSGTSLWDGGPEFSKMDIQEAITSMEAHTSFHVKYGFKAIPNNPLADESVQNEIKAAAAVQFPEMKSKPGFIAYLKSKLGLSPAAKQKQEDATGAKINLGSRSPESGVQGLDGGTFTVDEIQQAVDILEAFNGKNFKSHLNQKGSPLGQLDPNKLVGYDADKTKSKQKLIDLLKTKIANHKSADTKTKTLSYNEFYKLPVGSSVKFDDGQNKYDLTKTGGYEWTDQDGIKVKTSIFVHAADEGHLSLVKSGDGATPTAHMSKEDFQALPVGSNVRFKHTNIDETFTKTGEMEWTKDSDQTIHDEENLFPGVKAKAIYLVSDGQSPKVLTHEEVKGLPVGSKLSFKDNYSQSETVFEKTSKTEWTSQTDSSWLHEDDMEKSANDGKLTLISKPDAAKALRHKDMKDAAIGTVAQFDNHHKTNPSAYKITKTGPTTWTSSDDGMKISEDNFYPSAQAGYVTLISEPNKKDAPSVPDSSPVVAPSTNVTSMKMLDDYVVGTVISHEGWDNKKELYTKVEGGSWKTGKGGNSATIPSSDFEGFFGENLNVESVPSQNEQLKDSAHVDILPLGTVMQYTGNDPVETYTKVGDSTWSYHDGVEESFLQSSSFSSFYNDPKLTIKSQPASASTPETSGSISSLDDVVAMAPGEFLAYLNNDGSPSTVMKLPNGKWEPVDGTLKGKGIEMPNKNFKGYAEEGKLFKSDEKGSPLQTLTGSHDPKAAVPMTNTNASETVDEALSILPASKRGKTGDGFVVVHTPKGPKVAWGRYGAGGVATVAVDKDGTKKVLIGKRGDRDEWYLPGGAIDEKESHLQGAFREFTEEVEGGDALSEKFKFVSGHEAVVGKIDGTDKDWKYVTVVADVGEVIDIKAPKTSEPWELAEYKWFSAEELKTLEATGKLHGALSDGALAKMVGFEKGDVKTFDTDFIPSNGPEDLSTPKYNITGWKKVGAKGGYNAGGVYEDENGKKYYVKRPSSTAGAHNEVLASALYASLGVNNNRVYLGSKDGQNTPLLVSPWVEHDAKAVPSALQSNDKEFLKKLQGDFAIDAWLSNYDVVGNDTWNLVADSNGEPLRIDPGGALMFRGTGAAKSWWSDNPTDIDDMRFGSSKSGSYGKASSIFGSMTEDDVAESAKKLKKITPDQIDQLVNASGFDDKQKAQLTATLIKRRTAILERYKLLDAPSADHPAETFNPVHKKGASIKIKGTGELHTVEMSTNEVAVVIMPNGDYKAFLNDEVVDFFDAADISKDYSFTSNGEEFNVLEGVKIPNPKGTGMLDASVLGADWNNGLVSVKVGNDIVTLDKMNIKKADYLSNQLPENYAPVPKGSKVLKVSDDAPEQQVFAVIDGDGKLTRHMPNGSVAVTYHTAKSLQDSNLWKDYTPEAPKPESSTVKLPDGYGDMPAGSKVVLSSVDGPTVYMVEEPGGLDMLYHSTGGKYVSENSAATLATQTGIWEAYSPSKGDAVAPGESTTDDPTDKSGNAIHAGDKVTIVKNNKGGNSNQGQIVSINKSTGKVRVMRLDEMGKPVLDENGKKKYATLDSKSVRRNVIMSQDNNLPTGVTMAKGDPDSPLYGTPAPQAPTVTAASKATASPLGDKWRASAEIAYAQYRVDKKLSPKKMNETSNWNRFQQAMEGDQSAIDYIETKGYFKSDPTLVVELKSKLEEIKSAYAAQVADHEAKMKAYHLKRAEWVTANGQASYTPLRHEDTLSMSDAEAKSWSKKMFTGVSSKLSAKGRQGLKTQKGSSSWQTLMRKLPAMLGMKREDVAKHASAENMKTWDNIKQASDEAGAVGVAWRGIRTVDADRFVNAAGIRFSHGADLSSIKGTIQKDHGAMELVPGSIEHGGKPAPFYSVYVDIAIPPEIKGVYTGLSEDGYSYSGEHGFIVQPGMAMYIWDVVPYKGTWKVKASLIPEEVLPYMNNFEGAPDSHNIVIP